MLLTQSTMPIIGWIATILGYVMEFIFRALSAVGIQNIGLCIVIFTFFVRLIILPLTIRQQKSTKITQIAQPEINKIQKKYRNKKDQASVMKQNEEIQAVYDKYGINLSGGCLQLVVQFPVFLALYQVIRKIPAYIPQVKTSYTAIVEAIQGPTGYIDSINKISDGLNSSYISQLASDASTNEVIDVLNYFPSSAWQQLSDAFPSASHVINTMSEKIIGMNNFAAGINVAQTPGFRLSVYLIIPILAALFQFLSVKTMQQPQADDSNPAAGMTKSTMYMMPLISLYFCIVMPAGLGIYWVSSALFQCVQQIVINRYLEHVDMDELIEKSREKAAKKKAKGKRSIMDRLMNNNAPSNSSGETQSRREISTISQAANMNLKKLSSSSQGTKGNVETYDDAYYDSLGEIGKKAYLVSKYEKEHTNKGR